MRKRTVARLLLVVALLAVVGAALTPWLIHGYWSMRSSNPVRRGVSRAAELGCFHCHGPGGAGGLPDPADELGVPGWGGGVWMMYVSGEREIRGYIVQGSDFKKRSAPDEPGMPRPIRMPPFGELLRGSDLEDLTAAFKVLSGMVRPADGTAAQRGLALAERWRCFHCHGPAGSGGRPNPGSFAGFIPGWYGADFEDLVRDRGEFDAWVREGSTERLRRGRVASFFTERQRVQMPRYRGMTDDELDDLWAYLRWLASTDGGYRPQP